MKIINLLSFLLLGSIALLQSSGADLKGLEEDFEALDISDDDAHVLARYPRLRDIVMSGGSLNQKHPYDVEGHSVADVYLFVALVFDDLLLLNLLMKKGAYITGRLSIIKIPCGEIKNSVQKVLKACSDLINGAHDRQLDRMQKAIAQGAYINMRDRFHGTPLMYAIAASREMNHRDIRAIKFLLSVPGVDVNVRQFSWSYRPLYCAIAARVPELVKILLAQPGIDGGFMVKDSFDDGLTLLEFAESSEKREDEKMCEIVALLEDFEEPSAACFV